MAVPALTSGLFRILVGSPSEIIQDQSYLISSVPVLAGEYFRVTPKLRLIDLGGNLVDDSSSHVSVSIDKNPSGFSLLPLSSLIAPFVSGVATFSVLKVDMVGMNLRLKYVLSTYSSLTKKFTETEVYAYSEFFNIEIGPPRSIRVMTTASAAMAGGQAFGVQPKIQLVDYGSNVIVSDYGSTVTCHIIESLSASAAARAIDTRKSLKRNSVQSVTLNIASGNYGKGQVIEFLVNFEYLVYLYGSISLIPSISLALDIDTASGAAATAFLSGSYSGVTTLTFSYTVQQGDRTSSLDYLSSTALIYDRNNVTFVDGNNNTVSLLLPSRGLPFHTIVVIDTNHPIIVGFSSSTVSGVYGAGEVIYFNVTYNYPIQVDGTLYLSLTALSGNQSANLPRHARAYFTGVNSHIDSRTLTFEYIVQLGDHTLPAQSLNVINREIYLMPSASIQRVSNTGSSGTAANTSLSSYVDAFVANHNIQIDEYPPSIDLAYGVRTDHANGTYYPGEVIGISIRFTKPVVAVGASINIYLQTGSTMDPLNGIALLIRVLNDSVTLLFEYVVMQETNTTRLDIISGDSALFVDMTDAYIRRKSSTPTLDADISTAALFSSGHSLRHTADIRLYGFRPVVQTVNIIKVMQAIPGKFLYPDDAVIIRLTYSTRVMTVCPAVILVDSGTFTREAPLIAGNQTQHLDFKYTVETGDRNPNGIMLSYSDPPPLCTSSGCSNFPRYCGIFANSTSSNFAADLRLPHTIRGKISVIAVHGGNYSILPQSLSRNTSVLSVVSRLSNGSFSPGTLIYIDMTFNDNIISTARSYPSLYLNIGKYSTYSGGFSTSTLTFLYITQANDSIASLLPINVPHTSSPIKCMSSDSCHLTNAVNSYVNLSVPSDSIRFPLIILDRSEAMISRVYTTLITSPSHGYYTVGQLININVVFTRPVIVVGTAPRMQMAVGLLRFAYYQPRLSSPDNLVFQLLVQIGDRSNNLAYSGPSIDLNFGSSTIYCAADVPTSPANLLLPGGPNIVAINSNIIRIDTSPSKLPHITGVFSLSPNGTYRAGDSFLIYLNFSHPVVLTGRSFLTLNMGRKVGIANLIGTNKSEALKNIDDASSVDISTKTTRQLYFYYTVHPGDYSPHLDYTDSSAFHSGLTQSGLLGAVLLSDFAASDSVSMSLPIPGMVGSLSSTSSLLIDGSPVYMTALSFITPPGAYSLGDKVYIRMNFSASVVVSGNPYLLLSTGDDQSLTRNAIYTSGSGSASIIFLYHPVPGDHSSSLDYVGDTLKLNSAHSSFQLNGGSILVASAKPILAASIFLSPPSGSLTGSQSVTASGGLFTFIDLSIDILGLDYLLRFSTIPLNTHYLLTVMETLFVSFSSQSTVRPQDAFSGDRVCSSVAVSGRVAACGAPNGNFSVTPIQTVSLVIAAGSVPRSEIQMFRTTLVSRPAIMQFSTTVDIGETVGGYFTMKFGDLGPSYQIPTNADADMMKGLLTSSIPELGNITITRQDFIYCACFNAFIWIITFNDFSSGNFPLIVFDSSHLTGPGVSLLGPMLLQTPAELGGFFTLQVSTAGGNQQSDLIPYDASGFQVAQALEQISLTATVTSSIPDKAGTRSWIVTFGTYHGAYRVPLLFVNATHLLGGMASARVEVVRSGVLAPEGITGRFALEWRGNTTTFLPHNISAAHMKTALEELPIIDTVNVVRKSTSDQGEYIWTIEFVKVNLFTSRGYVAQRTQNVELIIAHNYLDDSAVAIDVQSDASSLAAKSGYGLERQGSYGANAGSVYIYYQLPNGKWAQVDNLRGSDTSAGNLFGYSVALEGSVLLVGSIAGSNYGVPEIQSVFCSADRGHFRLTFRGWSTALLGVNATRTELMAAITSDPRKFANLYSITAIAIEDWGPEGLCSNNTAVITFFTPFNDDIPIFGINNGPELELIGVVFEGLEYSNSLTGVVIVTEVQKGTRVLNTLDADVQQHGVAYLFYETDTCSSNLSSTCLSGNAWTQHVKLSPINPTGFERYGSAVALGANIAVVGSPGSKNESGSVYVYILKTAVNSVTTWPLLQQITALATTSGDNFGHSVALQGNTLVVGALYASGGIGSVYVFRAPRHGAKYGSEQILFPVLIHTLSFGSKFGHSVAISGDTIVVGAPMVNDYAIYLGKSPSTTPKQASGAVFVFHRLSYLHDFQFLQKLVGANVRSLDRLGWAVDIKGDTILVGALEDFAGTLGSSRATTEVSTQCNYGSQIGNTFKLIRDDTMSRDISYNASAATLATVLEMDLLTGPVFVSRSDVDLLTGGYIWTVTFLVLDSLSNGYDFAPILLADSSSLTGENSSVHVLITNSNSVQLRGKSHLFRRDNRSFFTEQLYLSPFSYQPADQCGHSVALLDEYFAFVGCPNRDELVPNSNHGGGIFFNLSLLKLKFGSYSYNVTEGNTLNIIVHRDSIDPTVRNDIYSYLRTLDRNAPLGDQLFAGYIYNILDSNLPPFSTVLDVSGLVGKAIARSQYYGSSQNQSSWISGMYDYRGISDYVPFNKPLVLTKMDSFLSMNLITNMDGILEVPDETVTVAMTSPGLWPSTLGRFLTSVTLVNAGDGFIDGLGEYEKVYSSPPEAGIEFGHAVVVISSLQAMFSSAPLANVGTCLQCGKVSLSRLSAGSWSPQGMIVSPNASPGAFFGDDLAASFDEKKQQSLLIVGEPGSNSVHVYLSQGVGLGLVYSIEATLSVPDATLRQHRLGSKGTIALAGSLLIVGAPGLEAAYVFRRVYSNTTSTGAGWAWTAGKLLRSPDFGYDIINSIVTLHKMDFGKSVAASGRSFAIGAPYAEYDKIDTALVEIDVDPQGQDSIVNAGGKVYMFSSSAPVQLITLDAVQPLNEGQFRIKCAGYGSIQTTRYLNFNASAAIIVSALEELSNIGTVAVRTEKDIPFIGGFRTSWVVTFVDMWQEPAALVPIWRDYGCPTCNKFDFNSTVPSLQVRAHTISKMGPILCYQSLSANDARNGNRFGWSVSLDENQLAVGAIYSAAATTTTWDFETGTLRGWTAFGTAFAYQPTFGDNSKHRLVDRMGISTQQKSTGESSRMRGLYYIGTFEMRPGNSTDYRTGDARYLAGSSQGNSPQGVLTSDVFIIYGRTISFLLGGGCDYYLIYVELLIDGLSVSKVTGKCEERMRKASFDVSFLQLRAGQLRIVDASSGVWGHINVDEITFDWDVRGASINDSSHTIGSSPTYNGKETNGGMIETPNSGAAYTFLRHITGSNALCELNITLCSWKQETKLVASDKRANALFGSSVAVNNAAGVVVVGAPNAAFTGCYREVQSVYPHQDLEIEFPVSSSFAPLFEGLALYSPEASGAYGYWYLQQMMGISSTSQSFEQAGAVYIFVKIQPHAGLPSSIAIPQYLQSTEFSKVQPPDAFARDFFGASVALDGALLVVGSAGQDGSAVDGGAVYLYSMHFCAVTFTKVVHHNNQRAHTYIKRLLLQLGEQEDELLSDITIM